MAGPSPAAIKRSSVRRATPVIAAASLAETMSKREAARR